jgi:hypothetical protein
MRALMFMQVSVTPKKLIHRYFSIDERIIAHSKMNIPFSCAPRVNHGQIIVGQFHDWTNVAEQIMAFNLSLKLKHL